MINKVLIFKDSKDRNEEKSCDKYQESDQGLRISYREKVTEFCNWKSQGTQNHNQLIFFIFFNKKIIINSFINPISQ